jgi:hypothetical protein
MAIKSKMMRWVGHVASTRDVRYGQNILVEHFEGKRLLGRPRRRWKDIRMDLM